MDWLARMEGQGSIAGEGGEELGFTVAVGRRTGLEIARVKVIMVVEAKKIGDWGQ